MVIERTWWWLLSIPDDGYWAYLMMCYWAYLMMVIERTWWWLLSVPDDVLLSVPDDDYWAYLMMIIERTWWCVIEHMMMVIERTRSKERLCIGHKFIQYNTVLSNLFWHHIFVSSSSFYNLWSFKRIKETL
jgi:hypothetical protein